MIDDEQELATVAVTFTPALEMLVPDMDHFNSELLPSLGLDAITSLLTLLDYVTLRQAKSISDVIEISWNCAEFVAGSIEEFKMIVPSYNLDPISSERSFTEELSVLASIGSTMKNFPRDLDDLISKYSWQ
ncbi:hypothetical protein RMR16_024770 (plasmid) [Agrobacterium sp. rho-13.3]|uniref:hypothetical protein n=1 Tax=Agrobacterium sp. rho-13.3 TaxID=3072980 RepID=UPI002A11318B|nr:hypothetical protein [Agrobacterium sp. rho-13.3]MDX8310166.1 hypothetical protein [Agrobacterium sp. rho-13.3]